MYSAEPEDPCPSTLDYIVADMCSDDSVVEDSKDGSKAVDSVLLRINKQQNDCICHVNLHNNVTNYTIHMSKYEGLGSSAPEQQNCGLAVDVEYQETSGTTRNLTSIECTSGTNTIRSIALGGSELKLKTRIITDEPIDDCKMNDQVNKSGTDDDWIKTNGIQHTSIDECKQYCLQTNMCVAVHYEYRNKYCFVYNQTTTTMHKDNSTYSQKDCVDTKLKIKCYPPDPTTQTSRGPTTEDNISTKTETVTTPISNSPHTNSNTHSTTAEKKSTKDKNSDLYVYLGAGAGGVLMILLIVCIIVCIRKRANQTPPKESKNDSTKQFCREDRDSDNDYGGLKDNILYVSSEPNEILEDGNYNTVDLEQTRKVIQDINLDGNYSTVDGICNIIGSESSLSKSKPVIKQKPKTSFKSGSVDETIHLSTMDTSNNEYAVVDKGRNSDAAKHMNPEHGNDTEYAVVNKLRKSSNNN
ncbi:Hypothetical predicted protein [Mytilus galloprovincialis]|uniref:Apple domain-containing protein n=1 Tax=Mytilus galloprovincialis TaxID=29158 RepID=A0A8B6GA77_MYTGA|nr:Hypothetical predicted protein [Mytilus galloprovincialis]